MLTFENNNSEYCCSVVKIGELIPIENSDYLAKTNIFGTQIVVRKDIIKEGDIMFYARNETELNSRFLSVNNLYEIGCRELNSNYPEVKSIMDEYDLNYKSKNEALKSQMKNIKASINTLSKRVKDLSEELKNIDDEEKKNEITKKIDDYTKRNLEKTVQYTNLKQQSETLVKEGSYIVDKAKKLCGLFNKYGRVRCVVLRGEPSFGFLFSIDYMIKYCPEIANIQLEDYLDKDFDTVNGELFVKAYIPRIKEIPQKQQKTKQEKAQKKLSRFNRIIDGEFSFHYDTNNLDTRNIQILNPETSVAISVKIHGTSVIIGKLKVKQPKKINIFKRIWNLIAINKFKFIDYDIVYGPIYSSRKVIKNQYINKNVSSGYYSKDIYSEYGDLIYPYLEEGMTVYGEIFGYVNNDKMIQKFYDYGCNPNENKLMIYRITTTNEDGTKREWNIDDVKEWTEDLKAVMKANCDEYERIHPIDVLYDGKLSELYPDIKENWHNELLNHLQNDKEHFGMECYEILCNNKVPREGICIRINNDIYNRCFKVKTNSFKLKEAILIDSGEVDMEMENNYIN